MMGGDDLILEGKPGGEEIDLAVRWIRREWRWAIIDVPGRRAGPVSSEGLFPLMEVDEVFIYRDQASFDSWQQVGLTEQNADAVIWISRNADCLSFVMDDRNSRSGRLVQELIESLRQHRWQLHDIEKDRQAAA